MMRKKIKDMKKPDALKTLRAEANRANIMLSDDELEQVYQRRIKIERELSQKGVKP